MTSNLGSVVYNGHNGTNGCSTNNNKLTLQQQISNGLFIRKEIQRFESVHPNIYSLYELIESLPDFNLQQQIRDHVVNIEDSFVNSQEWTLSRSVPDLKLGILGGVGSGKSSLVHRFLTGNYVPEDSPEGGRFKKEVIIDGQSYLLLIRDEGGPPEMQFTHWVDAVVFVFSLENEESFLTAHQYYLKMTHYRNMSDVPFILVGTQDYVNESSPRVVDEQRARSLANELKKCSYYETCAPYGLNVERVFHEACQKVANLRSQLLVTMSNIVNANNPTQAAIVASNGGQQSTQSQSTSLRSLTGSHNTNGNTAPTVLVSTSLTSLNNNNSANNSQPNVSSTLSNAVQSATVGLNGASSATSNLNGNNSTSSNNLLSTSASSPQSIGNQGSNCSSAQNTPQSNGANNNPATLAFYLANPHLLNSAALHSTNIQPQQQQQPVQQQNIYNTTSHIFKEPFVVQEKSKNGGSNLLQVPEHQVMSNHHLVTPISTPNQKRKDNNRRRSNLFTPNKKEDKQKQLNDVGIGRSIPVKQGFLYKKTNSTINKDWKKKFVTLNDDGSLRYYPSMNDYMDDSHGKEIDLQKTTIKIPGANKPRIGKSVLNLDTNKLNTEGAAENGKNGAIAAFEHHDNIQGTNQLLAEMIGKSDIGASSKKRHRRVKSNHKSDQNKEEDQEGFEFIIVSLDNKQWHFEAASNDEREEWVQAIEQQILSSLQTNETNKLKTKHGAFTADSVAILNMKCVPGNSHCADCDALNPVWASLNHGSLICIECSGIHRNLGTHLSRVRSLELDDWSNDLILIMTSIGNRMINSVYEANIKHFGRPKPTANSNREEKEKWIRAKYESKLFLAPLPNRELTTGKQLLDAVSRQDIPGVLLCLAYSKSEDVNCPVSQLDKRTSLHIAASQGNLVALQLLIWYGADVECVDNQGRNALTYARQSNSAECCQLLIHNGCSDTNQQVFSSTTSMTTLNRKANSVTSASTSQIGSLLANTNLNTNLQVSSNYDKLSFNNI